MSRYIIYEGSKSGHCCFKATVMDSTKPEIIDGECYETICAECFNMGYAELVRH